MSDIVTHADICGRNPVFPASRLGCGQPILTCAEVYRCVDCQTPFHKDCLHKHCESELTTVKSERDTLKARCEKLEGESPYWLLRSLAESFVGKTCERQIADNGEIACHQSSDCITEWCNTCATIAWLEGQKESKKPCGLDELRKQGKRNEN